MRSTLHGERLSRLHGLYGIVCDDGPLDPLRWAQALHAGGACAIQLRFKRLPPREALAVARTIRAALPDALLILNDRPDLAVLSEADGAHVGDADLSPADARAVLGPDRLLGATVRSMGAARAALDAGADHLGVGPIFASRTKSLEVPLIGLAGLSAICRAVVPAPVVAISGLDQSNVGEVARAGASCAAVVSSVGGAADPTDAARRLAGAFVAGRPAAWTLEAS